MLRGNLDERGNATVSAIIGIILLVIVGLAGALTYSSIAKATTNHATAEAAQFNLDKIKQTFQAETHSANALFLPAKDIFGAANAVGNVPVAGGVVGYANPGAHEIDFYARDAQKNPHFWAYYYDSASKTLSKYFYTKRDATGTAVGVNNQPFSTMAATVFSASYLKASVLGNVNQFLNTNVVTPHGALTDYLVQLGYPEVYAGNRLVSVDVWEPSPTKTDTTVPANLHRHIELLAGNGVAAGQSIAMTYSPPPSGGMSSNPIALNYASPFDGDPTATYSSGGSGSDASGVVTMTEANYHRPFTASSCVDGSGTTVATANGGGVGPSGTLNVVANGALRVTDTCTLTVSSQDGQSANVAVTVNVAAHVVVNQQPVCAAAASYANQSDTYSPPNTFSHTDYTVYPFADYYTTFSSKATCFPPQIVVTSTTCAPASSYNGQSASYAPPNSFTGENTTTVPSQDQYTSYLAKDSCFPPQTQVVSTCAQPLPASTRDDSTTPAVITTYSYEGDAICNPPPTVPTPPPGPQVQYNSASDQAYVNINYVDPTSGADGSVDVGASDFESLNVTAAGNYTISVSAELIDANGSYVSFPTGFTYFDFWQGSSVLYQSTGGASNPFSASASGYLTPGSYGYGMTEDCQQTFAYSFPSGTCGANESGPPTLNVQYTITGPY